MSDAPAVTDANFDAEVLQSDQPVLVDFWAEWCPPCRQMGPIIDDIAGSMAGKLKVVKLNVDENPMTSAKYGISSIPTFNVYKGGEVAASIVGARPKAMMVKEIEGVI